MNHRLARNRDSRGLELLLQILPESWPVGEGLIDQPQALVGLRFRDSPLPEPGPVRGHLAWPHDRMKPPVVLRPDHVEGAAIEPSDHDPALVNLRGAW